MNRDYVLKLARAALFLALFIDGLGISLILPLFPELFLEINTSILPNKTSLQIRNMYYMFSLVSFSIGMFFGAPLLGEMSDKLGRKKILIFSLIGTVIGYLISSFGISFKNASIFIIGRVVDGITAGSISISQAMMIDSSKESEKTKGIGFVLFAVTSGYFLGPILAGVLSNKNYYKEFDLCTPFYATALLSFLSILLLLPLKETQTLDREANKNIKWTSWLNFFDSLKKIRSARDIIFLFFLFQLGWTLYYQYLPCFLGSYGNFSFIAQTLSIVGIGMAISFCFLISILQKKLGTQSLAIFSLFMVTLSTLLQLIIVNQLIFFEIACFMSAIGYGLGYCALLGLLSEKISKDHQGLIMGVAASMSAFSATVSGVSGYFLLNVNVQVILILASCCFLICFLTLMTPFPLRKGKKYA